MRITVIFIVVLLQFSYSSCKKKSRRLKEHFSNQQIFEESNSGLEKKPLQSSYILQPGDVRFCYNAFNADLDNWTERVVEIRNNDTQSLNEAKLIPNVPYKFFIHGFTKNVSSSFPLNVISGYKFRIYGLRLLQNSTKEHSNSEILYPSNYNLIAIDWGAISGRWDSEDNGIFTNMWNTATSYIRTVHKVEVISQEIAIFVEFLLNNNKIHSLQDVHIIGFSLGAQIASKVGVILKQKDLAGKSLGRITGLDPAFLMYTPSNSLSKDDASFVDVIHSGGMGAGVFWNSGDLDIYPCKGKYFRGWVSRCNKEANPVSCAHNIAHQLYTLSILGYKNKNFPIANKTDFGYFGIWPDISKETALFGEFVEPKTNGTYCFDEDSLPSTDLIDFVIDVEKCTVIERKSPQECEERFHEKFIEYFYIDIN